MLRTRRGRYGDLVRVVLAGLFVDGCLFGSALFLVPMLSHSGILPVILGFGVTADGEILPLSPTTR